MLHLLRPRESRAGLTALLCAAALFIVPAAAEASCAATPTVKAFQSLGDSADYSLVPNGAFESGAGGWLLTGAATATGNESYFVHGSRDSMSLAVKATGLAVSPAICVGVEHPTFRFFAKRTSGSWGALNVKLRWQEADGRTNETVVSSIGSGTAWSATKSLSLAATLPLWNSGQTLSVRLVFDPENFGGNWAIDDVYVDPFKRG